MKDQVKVYYVVPRYYLDVLRKKGIVATPKKPIQAFFNEKLAVDIFGNVNPEINEVAVIPLMVDEDLHNTTYFKRSEENENGWTSEYLVHIRTIYKLRCDLPDSDAIKIYKKVWC